MEEPPESTFVLERQSPRAGDNALPPELHVAAAIENGVLEHDYDCAVRPSSHTLSQITSKQRTRSLGNVERVFDSLLLGPSRCAGLAKR